MPRPASLVPIFESLRVAGLDERELAAADVVTWRGNFAKILGTPWNARDAWHMEAELVHGVAVLNVLEPPASLARESQRQGRDALMAYWGYSFEEACTGGMYDEPIDCLDAFCAVVRTGVGRHRLIMGGEVDCWDGERTGLAGYVELKTTRVMDNPSQVARFERDKLLKWWAQSFPIGVRRIVVGFRDDAGFCRKLQTLETLKLPGYAARHPRAWDPKTALRFADRLLTWLRKHLEQLPEGTRVRLEYEPNGSQGGGGRVPKEVRLRVCDDGEVPDFVPATAREALLRAAAMRAASAAASSGGRGSSLRSGSKSDRANSGGSVGQTRVTNSGPAEVASRRSALKRPSPASSKDGEVGLVSGGLTAAAGAALESAKAVESSGGAAGGGAGVGNRGGFDASGGANPSASDAPPPGTVDDLNHHRRDDHHSHHHHSHLQQAPATRVAVHWAGAEPPAQHYNHRRRRRQERSQTPVPGARSLQHLYRFYQPIVAGPGFGDPLKMAADKQAYARSLGPSAMSYLMGFVPGDQGWIGGGGDDDDDGDKDDDDDKADGIDGGINADKKGAGINGSSTKDRGYGLDPKAYAFDPMNPAASAKAAAAMTVAGSEGDGQQSSFVAAGSGEEMGEDDGQEGGGGSGGAGSVGGRSTDSRSDASRRRSGGGGFGGGAGGGGEQREVGSTPQTATSANDGRGVGVGGVEGAADEEEGGGSGTKKPRSG